MQGCRCLTHTHSLSLTHTPPPCYSQGRLLWWAGMKCCVDQMQEKWHILVMHNESFWGGKNTERRFVKSIQSGQADTAWNVLFWQITGSSAAVIHVVFRLHDSWQLRGSLHHGSTCSPVKTQTNTHLPLSSSCVLQHPLVEDNTHLDFGRNTHSFQVMRNCMRHLRLHS